jgi:NAD(P)-dependent dehydrogenase (short-subunit alcohol dehydrogenase family)
MSRKVVITGSAGHIGQALCRAYRENYDRVIGVDTHDAEVIWDLDEPILDLDKLLLFNTPDIVICNAKCNDWRAHHALAALARDSIVNIGSIYGVLGSNPSLYKETGVPQTPPWYVAAKGAMIALTKHQATTLAPVRSNCVCPGGLYRDQDFEFQDRYTERVPLKRMATESDVVNAVMFLTSDKASYITGQTLMVDGGLSAW